MEEIYTVYILYSNKYDKIYIGYTSNLIARFHSHNSLSKKGYTKKYRPWQVIHVETYSVKRAAMDREKYLKSGVGRQWIHKELLNRTR